MTVIFKLQCEKTNGMATWYGKELSEEGKVADSEQRVGEYVAQLTYTIRDQQMPTKAKVSIRVFGSLETDDDIMGLEGEHDDGSGQETGSVTSGQGAFAAYVGKQFQRVGDTLTIG